MEQSNRPLRGQQPEQATQPPIREEGFYRVPDSAASNLILEVLAAGEEIAELPERKKRVSHGVKLEVLENGQRRQVNLKNKTETVTIELADINKLTGHNRPAKKLFVLALIMANEQALHNGELTREYVSFPLQELVDIGFYKSLKTARAGFLAGADTLTSLKVKGHYQYGKKKNDANDALRVLFPDAQIVKGQCSIYLNPRINWGFIATYFTKLPRYYFRLSNRGSDLLYYIFYMARQKTTEIKERGYFTIGFRAIQYRLQLPSEVNNTNPYRTIREPIESAIEEIEEAHASHFENMDFGLLPVFDDTAPIADYLDRGYLRVELKGEFAADFIALSEAAAAKIAAATKKRERIQEQAIAINTAKKMAACKKDSKGEESKSDT